MTDELHIRETEKEETVVSSVSELPEGAPIPDEGQEGLPASASEPSVSRPLYRLIYMVDGEIFFEEEVEWGRRLSGLQKPKKNHYTFSGWEKVPSRMPKRDVILTGHFIPNDYTVTFRADGVTVAQVTAPYGSPLTPPAQPEKEGCDNGGWGDLPATIPGENTTYDAVYLPREHTVTFVIDNTFRFSYPVKFGEPVEALDIPKKENYTFGGWSGLPETMPDEDVVVQGSFILNQYRLTRIVDGEVFMEETLPAGAPVSKKSKPQKHGYYFSGWRNLPKTMPPHDVTVVASMYPARFRVDFMLDGDLWDSTYYPYGEPIAAPTPSKTGYSFDGWSDLPEVMPDHDIVVHGALTVLSTEEEKEEPVIPIPVVIPVSGSDAAPVSAAEMARVAETEEHAPETVEEVPAQTPAEPMEEPGREETEETPVAAHCAEKTPTDTLTEESKEQSQEDKSAETASTVLAPSSLYVLSFVADGQTVFTAQAVAGQSLVCPAAPERKGYTFLGWEDVPAVMPDHALVITGHYQAHRHTVTYRLGDAVWYTASCAYEQALPTPPVPSVPAGQVFYGWEDLPETMPDHDLTLVGRIGAPLCHITFRMGEETVEQALPYGSTITYPTAPEREGYTFCWEDAPTVVPASGTATVNGIYQKNTYTITYLVDGKEVASEQYAYGDKILPHVPTPEERGFVFLSWEGLPETMPAADLSVQAAFSGRAYHVTFMLEDKVFFEADVPAGSPTPRPEVPERPGYVFDGWKNYIDVMPPYHFTAYGTYSVRRYTLTYLCGEETVGVQQYQAGEGIVPLVAPARSNYVFRAWEGLPSVMPGHDVVVSARYQGNFYRISYLIDGSMVSFNDIEMGSRIVPPEVPPRVGMTFAGWQGLPEFMPDRELIVTGTYELSRHTVTYMVDAVEWRVDTYDDGAVIVPPSAPERESERFSMWRNLPVTMPPYDIICQAVYEDAVSAYRFVLDGAVLSEGQARKGDSIEAPTPAHRAGLAFSGWEGYNGIMPGEDVTYTGTYIPDSFKVRYLLDGEEYQVIPVTPGTKISLLPPPVHAGYLFSGWSKIPSIMPEDDVTVVGRMVPIRYPLTYRIGKDLVYAANVECDSPLVPPEAPVRQGYQFDGWQNLPETMPAAPLTVMGTVHPTENRYCALETDATCVLQGECIVKKEKVRPSRADAIISGENIYLVIENMSYRIPLDGYMVNGKILDLNAVVDRIRRAYKKYSIPKKKLRLLYHPAASLTAIFDLQPKDLATYEVCAQDLFSHEEVPAEADYRFCTLSQNRVTQTSRLMASVIPAGEASRMMAAFARVGVTVTSVGDLTFEFVSYLQRNRNINDRAFALYCLPDSVMIAMLVDGQVVHLERNVAPFSTEGKMSVAETAELLRRMAEYLLSADMSSPLDHIYISGADSSAISAAQKCVHRFLRECAKQQTGLFGFSYHKLKVVKLGFAASETKCK